jgi:hypothetical protein
LLGLRKLERGTDSGRLDRQTLDRRIKKALRHEHLSKFVHVNVKTRSRSDRYIGRWMKHVAVI